MAYTVSNIANSVFGNKNVKFLRVTTDAATGVVPTGFSIVETLLGLAPQSMGTAGIKIKLNEGVASTATVGSLGITGCATGDVFFLTVVGR